MKSRERSGGRRRDEVEWVGKKMELWEKREMWLEVRKQEREWAELSTTATREGRNWVKAGASSS